MDVANIFDPQWEHEQERDGYRWRGARIGRKIGAERIGATVYELAAGERTFPYHFHHGNEEWLLVVDGEPTIRTPAGERALRRGDVVCFQPGPGGAHVVAGPGRVLIVSTMVSPSIAVYPDSDKLGTRPGGEHPDLLNFRRGDAVDYWDGE
ncbi:MAG: cupin domain-containing protein [Gaiellaceae bacterium]